MNTNAWPAADSAGFTCCIFSFATSFAGLVNANLRKPPALRLLACYALGGDSTRNLFCKLVLQMGLRVDDLSIKYINFLLIT